LTKGIPSAPGDTMVTGDSEKSSCGRSLGEQQVLKRPGREEIMKIRLVVALVGLAISFAAPSIAQDKDTVDLRIARQRDLLGDANALGKFGALGIKADEAFNKNDAGAVAALFTEDGVLVASDGMFYGRRAIEKRYADTFQRWPISTFSSQMGHQLNAIDNAAWSAGEWWSTLQSQTGPKFEQGYWSAIYVTEGDAWKIRLLSISETSRLVAPETN
jgi:ketosteroid isomerase-like protein